MANDTSWLRNRMAASAAALLAGAAIVAGGVTVAPAAGNADEPAAQAAQSATTTAKTVSGTYDAAGAKALLDRVNEIRAEVGVDPVTWSDTLAVAAQTRAAEVSVSFGHTRPDGTRYTTVSSQAQVESLATGGTAESVRTAADLLDQWYAEKSSYDAGNTAAAADYANLVDPGLTSIGLAMFTDADGTSYLVSEQGSDVVEAGVAPASGAATVSVNMLADAQAGGADGAQGGEGAAQQPTTPTTEPASEPEVSAATPTWATDVAVSCDYGAAPALPQTVMVSWSDDSTTEEPVVWDAVDGDATEVANNVFTVAGTVTVASTGATLGVNATVTVGAAPVDPDDGTDAQNGSNGGAPQDEDQGGADDQQPASQYVKSFTAPATLYASTAGGWKPAALACVFADGTEGTLDLDWSFVDGTAFDASRADEYADENGRLTLTAQVEVLDEDVAAQDGDSDVATFAAVTGTAQTVTQEVQLVDVPSDGQVARYLATVGDAASDVLPASITLTYVGAEIDVPVKWTLPEGAADAENNLVTAGEFSLIGTLTDGLGTVDATLAVSEAERSITGVTNPADVTTTVGTAPVLPEMVEVTYTDGTTGTAKVTWDEVDATQYANAGAMFAVRGAVEGTDLTAEVNVTVQAVPRTATSIEATAVDTTVGTAPVLPEAVRVTWDDGSQTEEVVTWDAVDAAGYAKAGQFVVSGTIAADSAAKATCTVTVKAAAPTPQSAANPAAVSTKAGTAPVLPATVTVTYTDGTTQQVEVEWNAVDEASYHNGGSFVVSGNVKGTGLTVQVTVNVADKTVTGIQNNLGVKTTAGTAPVLPKTASVRWSNGDVTDEPVSWNGVSPSQYAQAGTFNVTGTVAGYTVSCAVTVEAAQQQVAKTGDATNMVPVIVGAVVGVAAVAAAVTLIVRSRKK